MPNYKNPETDTFNLNGYIAIFRSGDKYIELTHSSSLSAHETFTNVATATNYKVPAGKKLLIITYKSGTSAHASHNISTTTAEDANTGAVEIISNAQVIALANDAALGPIVVTENLYVTFISADASTHNAVLACLEVRA